jgi:hypothetical protein
MTFTTGTQRVVGWVWYCVALLGKSRRLRTCSDEFVYVATQESIDGITSTAGIFAPKQSTEARQSEMTELSQLMRTLLYGSPTFIMG